MRVKIKKSHLKELIRQAIKEAVTEEKTYKAKKKDGKKTVFEYNSPGFIKNKNIVRLHKEPIPNLDTPLTTHEDG